MSVRFCLSCPGPPLSPGAFTCRMGRKQRKTTGRTPPVRAQPNGAETSWRKPGPSRQALDSCAATTNKTCPTRATNTVCNIFQDRLYPAVDTCQRQSPPDTCPGTMDSLDARKHPPTPTVIVSKRPQSRCPTDASGRNRRTVPLCIACGSRSRGHAPAPLFTGPRQRRLTMRGSAPLPADRRHGDKSKSRATGSGQMPFR